MRYSHIDGFEVCNGNRSGVSLFVQGCNLNCKNCFNKETWDFNGGLEWTPESQIEFLNLIERPFIKRVSFLGGEPLAENNVTDVHEIIIRIKNKYPDKKIWLYTGHEVMLFNALNIEGEKFFVVKDYNITTPEGFTSSNILNLCDYVVDGPFIDDLKDRTLAFRGSKNQRIIDIKKSLEEGEIVCLDL